MKNPNKTLMATILFVLVHHCAPGCTGFAMKDGKRVLAGFSYDHQLGAGHIYINQRNTERRRYLLYAERPVSWVSKDGNITSNPARIERGHESVTAKAVIITDRLKAGTNARLIVNLLSQEAALGSEKQFTILVRRETAVK